MTEIIEATIEHADAIKQIEDELFSVPWSKNGIIGEIQSADGSVFAAVTDGKITGFAMLHYFDFEAELYNIAVTSTMHRKGIGRMLMERVCGKADRDGIQKIFLEVRESNASARRLYVQFGFENVGLRKNYYDRPKENAVLMTREKPENSGVKGNE